MMQSGSILRALVFAAERHRDQRRKDAAATPYINHPIAVASILWHEGEIRDEVALVASILHDTIEDTATTEAELEARFGAAVAAVVVEVTDDKALPKARRKALQIEHAPHLSVPAKLVKLADKISNLRDILDSPPPDWPHERRHDYVVWTKLVVDGLRGVSPPLEAVFDAAQARWVTRDR